MRRTAVLAAAASCASIFGFGIAPGSADPAASAVPNVLLTAQDNGTAVSATVGTKVRLLLPENPSTGLTWQIRRHEGLTVLSSSFWLGPGSGLGSGGWRLDTFEADQTGVDHLRLVLVRPTNPGSAAQVFTATVNVSG